MNDSRKQVPANVNGLYADKFKFVMDVDRKNVEFFCQKIKFPGLSMTYQRVPNPVNWTFVGGKKLDYEDLEITFRVDEDLTNYLEILDWLVGIAAPQNTDQFSDFTKRNAKIAYKDGDYTIYNDATLMTLSNASNPNIKIFFKDIFPFALSGLDLDVSGHQPMTATVGFRYNYYRFES